MVRRRRPRNNKMNTRRRSGRRQNARFPSLPPRLPMSTVNYPRHRIRIVTSLTIPPRSMNVVAYDIKSIINNSNYVVFLNVFREYKIHMVKVWYLSGVSPTTNGTHTLVIGDPEEVSATANDRESDLASFPGSMTRRVTQSLHGSWFPTEPAQRNWNLLSSAHQIFAICYTSSGVVFDSEKITSLNFQMIMDFTISFRGVINRKEAVENVVTLSDVTDSASRMVIDGNIYCKTGTVSDATNSSYSVIRSARV